MDPLLIAEFNYMITEGIISIGMRTASQHLRQK